jgi:hypothetical protein
MALRNDRPGMPTSNPVPILGAAPFTCLSAGFLPIPFLRVLCSTHSLPCGGPSMSASPLTLKL